MREVGDEEGVRRDRVDYLGQRVLFLKSQWKLRRERKGECTTYGVLSVTYTWCKRVTGGQSDVSGTRFRDSSMGN